MSDHRRRARSPVGNPARMSAPIISAGTPSVNYGRSSDLHLHAVPTRREHFVSPRSSGASIETATHYKIKPDRDTLTLPRSDRSRSRRNTVDTQSKPIIVTPTTGYNVVVAEPRSAREGRDEPHSYREEGFIQPASSQHRHRDHGYSGYRGSSRGQHTIDNADISERHPHDREPVNDRLLRVGSAREGQMYPRARPITDDTLKRHPDTVKDDYGDDGYGYTNPRDLVEYDLENSARGLQGPQRSRSRRESWDNSRPGRPVSIGGYGDVPRPYDSRAERERGPPPSTRGFDKISSERPSSMYHMPGSMHMPMPHEHIAGSPLAQAPSSAYGSENLAIPQRRTSTRRPVSVYNDDRDRRDRERPTRDEYDIVDGRARGGNTFDDVQSRGFGIRPDLLPPSNVVTVQPPAAVDRAERVDNYDRDVERLIPRSREEKRYHDSGERRYHASERDHRRDDRDRGDRVVSDERRPDHDDRSDDRHLGTGVAAGSIAAAAMGIGASAAREPRHSDEEREREREREHRRRRRDSDQYHENGRPRRNTVQADEPPIVNLSGRYPIERTSPLQDGAPPREREIEHRDERDRDADNRRERDRDSDHRREPQREHESRRESPLQSEKVDLSDRHPVIERNVAKEDTHYQSDHSHSSPPISRRGRDRDREPDIEGRGGPSSRRDRIYEEAALGRDTISSPVAMDEKEARDLRALREDMGLNRAVDDSPPPPRPPKEPLVTSTPAVAFSRQSRDRISERPLDPPSRQPTDERSFVPPDMRNHTSTATNSSIPTQSSRDSRPSYRDTDRGYSSTSTSSSSGSNAGTPREHSRERTRDDKPSNVVQVVSPPRSPSSSQATLPVKGILKPPRVFPELPPEERPGVAPLIDKKTGKNWDGREMADVPPTARWTKISRKLVNPEALEKGKERYEVRDDFVVVLRVLTKDEVQGYAILTQNIRAQREDEEREERRRKRGDDTEVDEDKGRRRRRDDDETEDERAERKRKEREREERRRKYDEDETSEEREERKAKEREERHRKRREERHRREGREGETADEAEERRRREKIERHERHERRRREKREQYGDEEYDREREERRRRRERDKSLRRRRDRRDESESDTTDDERDDDRRRRRRDRDRD